MTEPPIEPITAAEEAFLVRRCAEIDRMAADVELDAQAEAPREWPVVVLDLDDVLCVNEHFGGLDALDALRGKRVDAEEVYARLWSPMAMTIMRAVHERFAGRLRFVISSTWRLHFTRAQLRDVMRRSGLGFVAGRMEPLHRWATPHLPGQSRAHEVLAWLRQHHRGEPYVVIDDDHSGSELRRYAGPGAEMLHRRVVLCQEWLGLGPVHVPRIVAALRTPCAGCCTVVDLDKATLEPCHIGVGQACAYGVHSHNGNE
jgi:hypothetical protein